MSRVTSRKKSAPARKTIREREQEARSIVDAMHEEEPFNFDKKDLLAMVIAGYQVILPFVLAGAAVIGLAALLFYLFIR